jgi:hypothetical protein
MTIGTIKTEAKEDLARELGIYFDVAEEKTLQTLLDQFYDKFGPQPAWKGPAILYTQAMLGDLYEQAGRTTKMQTDAEPKAKLEAPKGLYFAVKASPKIVE